MSRELKAMYFNGITPDTLGGYLGGLGLLSACSKVLPTLRGCWRDNRFVLLTLNNQRFNVFDYLVDEWSYPVFPVNPDNNQPYSPVSSTKSHEIIRIRSQLSYHEIDVLDALAVSGSKTVINPVLKNMGQRKFFKLLKNSINILERANEENKKRWLNQFLYGESTELPEIKGAGVWFPYANKTYNTGQKGFVRENGSISPWSILLAIEGAFLLQGGIGRRLSAKSRPYAHFPFISDPLYPAGIDSAGLKRWGEFWAPLWDNPATLIEIKTLLDRGLARLGNKSATSPHEFAVAAIGAGFDAGLTEMIPFELRQTTSKEVFESMPRQRIAIRKDVNSHRAAELISAIVPWTSHLPDSNQKKKFSGLRSPVEQAIITISEDPENPEIWRELLLKLANVQTRIDQDRTRGWRKTCIPLPKLSTAWLDYLWGTSKPDEIEIACAISSIGAQTDMPILTNIFGVKFNKFNKPTFKEQPASAIWNDSELISNLGNILHRRLVDGESRKSKDTVWPLKGSYLLSLEVLGKFLDGALDNDEIARWIPPLSLLDWRKPPAFNKQFNDVIRDGLLSLDGLFRPLLTSGIRWENKVKTFRPDTESTLRLISLLRQNDLETAVDFACARYRALGYTPIQPHALSSSSDEIQRLIAGLLIPVSYASIISGRERWLLETKQSTR